MCWLRRESRPRQLILPSKTGRRPVTWVQTVKTRRSANSSPRAPRRDLDSRDAASANAASKAAVNWPARSRTRNRKPRDALAEIHHEVAGLLRRSACDCGGQSDDLRPDRLPEYETARANVVRRPGAPDRKDRPARSAPATSGPASVERRDGSTGITQMVDWRTATPVIARLGRPRARRGPRDRNATPGRRL